jgi:TRAP-type C4-dicarboxylate transport system permease small subunit
MGPGADAAGDGHPVSSEHSQTSRTGGWLYWPARFADGVACALFAAVFLIFVYKIVMRYVAHDAVAWADEISVVLFIWIIFWANAFVVEDKRQITFDLLYRHLGPHGQRIASILRLMIIAGIFVYAAPGAIDYILFLWRERTPVMLWRLDIIYSCFGMFLVAVILRAAWWLVGLARRDWRQWL